MVNQLISAECLKLCYNCGTEMLDFHCVILDAVLCLLKIHNV
jgi:hypothetical protein